MKQQTIKHAALFSTTALVSAGIVLASPAHAADYGQFVATGETVTITVSQSETVEGDLIGVFSRGSQTTLTNAGTIRGNGSADGLNVLPEGGITVDGGPATITNSGIITGAGHGISTAYFYNSVTQSLEARAIGLVVENSGTIAGESNDGVRLIGGGRVTNSGTITGAGAPGADGVSMFAYQGQALQNYAALVVNAADGTISGQRFGIILSGGGEVENAGSITGRDGGLFIQGTASNSGDLSGLTARVVNSGTITGTRSDGIDGYGIGFGSDLSAATLENSGTISSAAGAGVFNGTLGDVTITNAAGGTIEGGKLGIYSSGSGSMTISNAGTIRGNGSADGLNVLPEGGITVDGGPATITNSRIITGAVHGV